MKIPLNRRQFVECSTAAGLSGWLGQHLAAADARGQRESTPFRRCMTLWMAGGPSQFETFFAMPGTEAGGPTRSVATSVPGIQYSENLSALAKHAGDLCLLQSVSSSQGEHERATYLMHTGFERVPTFPRPTLGAYVSHRAGAGEVPGYVSMGAPDEGPAYLGSQHAPFVIENINLMREAIRRVSRRRSRLELIADLNSHGGIANSSGLVEQRTSQIETVQTLVNSPFAGALDYEQESPATRARYGDTEFGRRVLVGRRLLQAGVNYVEVQMPGWDTHVDNFRATRRLTEQLQPAWIALMQDLKSAGLWDDTLILWMGEFGRTPHINASNGRDHFPQFIPVVLAGPRIGGQVIGQPNTDRHHVGDLMYTLLSLLGIDPECEFTTAFGSPTAATDGGSMIAELQI